MFKDLPKTNSRFSFCYLSILLRPASASLSALHLSSFHVITVILINSYMTELGYNTLDTTYTGAKRTNLHCTNPDCYDDNCHGECLEEECCNNDCGCDDQTS